MSEIRTGLDLCRVSRMEKLAENGHFCDRVFTPGEMAYAASRGVMRAASLAGIWAAKEALFKALGTGINTAMTEIEIIHDAAGAPGYRLSGKAAEGCRGALLSLSITHEDDMAAAVCVLLRLDREDNTYRTEEPFRWEAEPIRLEEFNLTLNADGSFADTEIRV